MQYVTYYVQLVFYVGEEPLEDKLCREPVLCIFIFRSFRQGAILTIT